MRTLLLTLASALVLASCAPRGTQPSQEQEQAPAQTSETKMIRLNVFVTTTPEHLAEVVEGLNTLAAASRAESGCKGYEIYQSTIEPTRLFIVETWAGEDALSIHNESEHFTTILPPLMDGKMSLELERFEY